MIHRAAISLRAGRIERVVGSHIVLHVAVEPEAGAAHLQIEFSRDGEHGVAHFLGAEAARWKAPEQPRVLVHAGRVFARYAALPVSLREEDFAMQRLEFPPVCDEPLREKIEQLGMRRLAAEKAEVARRVHESRAEVVLPHAVREHARGERIARAGDPPRERETALALRRIGRQRVGRGNAVEHGEARGHDGVAGLHRVTAFVNARRLLHGVEVSRPHARQRRHGADGGLGLGELALGFVEQRGVLRRRGNVRGDGLFQLLPRHAQLADAFLQRLHGVHKTLPLGGRGHDALAVLHALEGGAQAVVILRRDRVEFVIVAARAVDREAEKRGGRRGDDVVERRGADVRLCDHVLIAHIVVRPRDEKRRADFHRGIIPPDHIAREMLGDETVERLVVIQRADDVVAERPGVVRDDIALKARALAKAHDIEPVPAPLLAVVRAGEQFVDEVFIGLIGLIRPMGLIHESLHFLGRWRQAGEVVGGPADERARVGGLARRETFLRELRKDEAVDGILRPCFRQTAQRWRLGVGERLQRPPRRFVCALRFERAVARIGRAHFHPRHEVGDDRVRQLRLLRRHGRVGVLVPHGLDELARVRLAGDDSGLPAVAASLPARARVEKQPGLQLFRLRAMALVAVLHEHRPDLLLEELHLLRRQICGQREAARADG